MVITVEIFQRIKLAFFLHEFLQVPFPKLHFTPSTIRIPVNGAKEINLLISSDLDGPNGNVAVLPSVEIHEEHLPFSFATVCWNFMFENLLQIGESKQI